MFKIEYFKFHETKDNKMFKKSLVALALITASTGAMAAADIETGSEANAIDFSIEGSASKAEVLGGDIEVTLGAEYTVGDIMTFTFTGGDVDVATAPTSYTTNGVAVGSLTVGLLSSSANSLTYRVTEIVAGGTTIGEDVVLAGLEYDTASVVTSKKVSVNYAAETSTGVAIDEGSMSNADIITASNQFSVDGTATVDFDEVVDVDNQRLTFELAATADSASLTTVSDGALTYPATAATADIVLNGSFAFLDEDDTTDGIQITAGTVVPAPTTIEADKITWDGVAIGAVAITIETANKPADSVIPAQTFSFDVDVDYTDHGTAEAAGTAAAAGTASVATGSAIGEWTLNGKVATINYMPFGDNTQVIMRATNTGAQTGDVTVRYMLEGVDTSWKSISGTVLTLAPGVTNIADLVLDAIKADSGMTKGKAAIEVTANVPEDDATIYAAYKVLSETDRGFVGNF